MSPPMDMARLMAEYDLPLDANTETPEQIGQKKALIKADGLPRPARRTQQPIATKLDHAAANNRSFPAARREADKPLASGTRTYDLTAKDALR